MFTTNQIEEIRQKLQLTSSGIKDTQFPIAEMLEGEERLAIIQGGKNKQLPIRNFIDNIATWCKTDFINISKTSEEKYTLEEAIQQVDIINRRAGQMITFIDADTGEWLIYQFKGTDDQEWLILDKWENILEKADTHFKGWFLNQCQLVAQYSRPKVGDFAFVGETLPTAVTYGCIDYGNWYNSNEPAIGDGSTSTGTKVVEYTIDSLKNNPKDFYYDLTTGKIVYIDGNPVFHYYNVSEIDTRKILYIYTLAHYQGILYVNCYNVLFEVTLGTSGNESWSCLIQPNMGSQWNFFKPIVYIEVDGTETSYTSLSVDRNYITGKASLEINNIATYFLQECEIWAKVKGDTTYWRLDGMSTKSTTSSAQGSIKRYMYLMSYNERYEITISWNLDTKTLTTLATLIE